MKKLDIDNCRFSNWYPNFKQHAVKSVVIDLDDDFVDYLLKEGPLVLPSAFELPQLHPSEVFPVYDDDSDNEWSENEEEENEAVEDKTFPELLRKLQEGIEELGGRVFPKLEWSSPRDAEWVLHGSGLKCTTPGEVVMLLKSSAFATYDLTAPYKICDDDDDDKKRPRGNKLVLKRWMDIHPATELRCFVKHRRLVAVSQRHHRHHYKHVADDVTSIRDDVQHFVNRNVLPLFPSQNYVVDLCGCSSGKLLIVDFNPFSPITTESLLFEWDEIDSEKFDDGDNKKNQVDLLTPDGEPCGKFRFVSSDVQMQPSQNTKYHFSQDFVDLTSGNDVTKLIDLMRLKTQNGDDSSSDEDDTWRLPETT